MQVWATVQQQVVVVVTHGEMIEALGDVVGESLSATNAQIVPLMVHYEPYTPAVSAPAVKD